MDLSHLLGKYGAKNATEPTKVKTPLELAPPTIKILVCDSCGDPLSNPTKLGKLSLCAKCYPKELAASTEVKEIAPNIPEYKTWPQCSKCGGHAKAEFLTEGLCRNCYKAPKTVDLVGFKTTDTNKYQEFFNQATPMIVDIIAKYPTEQEALNEIKEFIINTQQDIFSKEADLLRLRTYKQAAQIKFNAILQKLSLDDQKKYKIEDSSYVSTGQTTKRLASPLKQDKAKKIKKSLDDDINSLFNLKGMTTEQIAIAKKKLGL